MRLPSWLSPVGLKFKRPETQNDPHAVVNPASMAVVPPRNDDAAYVIETAPGGAYGVSYNFDADSRNERALIDRYRKMAMQPELDTAIDEIVNEICDFESPTPIRLNLDDLNYSNDVKKQFIEEFQNILSLLNFNRKGYEIIRNWYVDGRIFYHKLYEPNNERLGLTELRSIDARSIKKIREITRSSVASSTIQVVDKVNDYYLYTEIMDDKYRNGSTQISSWSMTSEGIRINADAIAMAHSGLFNQDRSLILGFLHKSIKPLNQLRMVEDATVIYRMSRAPERRLFYIDTGNMPPQKAEQYVASLMTKFRNKLVYDSSTGELRDEKQILSMMEDFWLPRREGGKGTEISTLQGGANLGQIEDVEYFQKRLLRSLNIPSTRLQSDGGFSLGKSNEITRDEVKFYRFICRLRNQFSQVLDDLLKTQLVLKKVIGLHEWEEIKSKFSYVYEGDNYFEELKRAEVISNRVALLQNVDQFVGKYYSKNWVQKNILNLTDEEQIQIDEEILKEKQLEEGGEVTDEEGNPVSQDEVAGNVQDALADVNADSTEDESETDKSETDDAEDINDSNVEESIVYNLDDADSTFVRAD